MGFLIMGVIGYIVKLSECPFEAGSSSCMHGLETNEYSSFSPHPREQHSGRRRLNVRSRNRERRDGALVALWQERKSSNVVWAHGCCLLRNQQGQDWRDESRCRLKSRPQIGYIAASHTSKERAGLGLVLFMAYH